MTASTYVPVQPAEHTPECSVTLYRTTGDTEYLNRWHMPAEPCPRCRALWQRLEDAHRRRVEAQQDVRRCIGLPEAPPCDLPASPGDVYCSACREARDRQAPWES